MDRFSSNRLRRLLAALAALVLLALPAAPWEARAANSVATVGNYYQDTTNVTALDPPTPANCKFSSSCIYMFSRVPRDKQLVVTQVSCELHLSAGQAGPVHLFAMRPNGTVHERFQFMLPRPTPFATIDVLNETVLMLFKPKDLPLLLVNSSAAANFFGGHCAISGRLFNAN